jgi:ankyrin repeat protein
LLQAAEVGDLGRVRRLVLQEGIVNINCTDPLGRTPLHLAVANEQREVSTFMLLNIRRMVFGLLFRSESNTTDLT